MTDGPRARRRRGEEASSIPPFPSGASWQIVVHLCYITPCGRPANNSCERPGVIDVMTMKQNNGRVLQDDRVVPAGNGAPAAGEGRRAPGDDDLAE